MIGKKTAIRGSSRASSGHSTTIGSRSTAHQVIHPGGRAGTYSVIRVRRLAVGVLPIEPDGRVHLVGQWRFPLGRYSWEMPEGGAEPGEDAQACARRELLEETGLSAGRLEQILELDLSNSLTDERAMLFLATGLRAGRGAARRTPKCCAGAPRRSPMCSPVSWTGAFATRMTVAARPARAPHGCDRGV